MIIEENLTEIDFYTEVIDNFWDFWFSYNIALRLIEKHPELKIRYFWNNKKLFLKLSWEKNIPNIKYYDLKSIIELSPNKTIINFFDRKINYDYLYLSDYDINLINISYFSIHKWCHSLHNTKYMQKNVKITHFVPSLIEGTWWVILNNIKKLNKKDFFPNLDEKFYNKEWISVFVYKDTFLEIKKYILFQEDKLFFIFDDRNNISWKNIIKMPFMQIDDYYDFLWVCDKNIVRWENSFIASILIKKPFLWDIYKEPNNAHTYKLDDFSLFFWDLEYGEILKLFNLKNKEEAFKKFLDFSKKSIFEQKGEYVLSSCDLIKNLEELIFDNKKENF
jgi:hypothetical protein